MPVKYYNLMMIKDSIFFAFVGVVTNKTKPTLTPSSSFPKEGIALSLTFF